MDSNDGGVIFATSPVEFRLVFTNMELVSYIFSTTYVVKMDSLTFAYLHTPS